MTNIWTRVKKYYGFSKPYDFNVAIPALLNAIFFVAVLVKFVVALMNNNRARIYGPVDRGVLTFPSEMYYFYFYIFFGIVLLTIFIRRKKIYWPLLVWFAIEFCLGGWGKGLAPFDSRTAFDSRFNYHPLLQAVPAPNFKGRNDNLFIAHNSLGLRDTNNSTENLDRNGLIFVFGGSTTYDFALSQGDTWVEKLNGLLGGSYKLFNFGVPGYTTSEHVIQTAFYGDINGIFPSCAIYYDGWNDLRNAHIAGLDRGYADWHAPKLTQILRTRRAVNVATVSPMLKLAVRWLGDNLDTVRTPVITEDESPQGKASERLKSIYRANAATIAAINGSRGVKTVFVGQMLNKDKIMDDSPRLRDALPFVRQRDMWNLQAELNELLRADAEKDGFTYIDPDINQFDPSDFADSGHFSASGAKKFASRIADEVRRACPAS